MAFIQVYGVEDGVKYNVREEVMQHPQLSAQFTTETPLKPADKAELAAWDEAAAKPIPSKKEK